jgi:hypothetical protein
LDGREQSELDRFFLSFGAEPQDLGRLAGPRNDAVPWQHYDIVTFAVISGDIEAAAAVEWC